MPSPAAKPGRKRGGTNLVNQLKSIDIYHNL